MNKILLLLLCCSLNASYAKDVKNTNTTNVPSHRNCATKMPSIEWENNFQQQIQQFLANQQNNANNRLLVNYTIPVIVHVVYWNAVENISQAQINSQIDVLNADFAGIGFNSGNVPTAFASLKSNTNITFCLAQKNPNGTTLAEPGIDRINGQTRGFTNPTSAGGWTDTYIDASIKPNTIWDPTRYMNIWVAPLNGGLLGYATFPAGSTLSGFSTADLGTATTDGVVIGYDYFGTLGTVSSPFNKGRTATHEVGHWLGLRHISGDAVCGSDFCADTPPQRGGNDNGQNGLNWGCPSYPFQVNGCGSGTSPYGEMFMNFMDYTDDACMYMFTTDQRTRMQTAMANGTYRAPLANSTVCSITPQAPIANFSASTTSICPGNTVSFADLSTGVPTAWTWSFPGGTPSTSTAQNPTITYNSAGTYAVTLTATNSLGSDGETKTAYITVASPTGVTLPFTEGFQATTFPPTGWSRVYNSAYNWERTTGVGGFLVATSAASMYFHNFANDAADAKDDIISPVIDLNGANTPRLKFDVAYARYSNNSTDTLEVLLVDPCTGTPVSIYKKGGSNLSTRSNTTSDFVPTATQWRTDSVFIPNTYLNQKIKLIFRNNGAYGNNIYVDNINLYGITTTTATPTASFTVSDTTVCVGNNLTFTSTSTASTGSLDSIRWSILGGIPSTSTLTTVSSTFNTPGTYVITLRAYKSGNVSTATKSIRVIALPTVATTTGASSVCVGASTTFTNTTPNGTWSSSDVGVASVSANGIVTGNSVGTVEIIYTVTNANNCSNTYVKLLTVNASPTVPAITGASSVCVGSTTTFSNTTTGGTWSSSATSIASVNANGVVSGVSAGTANIYYSVVQNGCTTSVVKVITVNALPTVSAISGASSVCVGSTTTFSNTTTGGTWSSSATSIASVNANGVVSGVSAGTANIYYSVVQNGCTTSVVKVITVNASPIVPAISGASSVCVGSTTTFSNTTTGGTWSSSATNIASVNANGIVSGVSAGTAIISYTVTSNGCSTTVTKSITVNALPTVAAISGASSVCVGSTTTFSNSTTGGTWLSSTPTIASVNANGVVSGLGAGTANIYYSVIQNGCTTSVVKVITVNALPTVSAISGASSVCVGTTTTFSNSTPNGTWSSSSPTIASVNANGVVSGVSAGTATISYTVSSNGCSTTVTKSITVNASPTVPAITGASSVCVGSTTTFSNSTPNGTWSSSATNIASVNANGVVLGVSAGTAIISYTVTSNGCSTTVTKSITVNALPTVSAIAGASSVCVGSTTTFSNTTTGGTWSSSATGIASVNANGVVSGASAGTAIISYTVTSNGCTTTVTKSITVNALPTVSAISGASSVCVGSTTTFSNSTPNGTWSSSALTIASVDANGVVSGLGAGTANIYYSVIQNGCTTSVVKVITVNALPNANAGVDKTITCTAQSVQLNGSSTTSGVSYSWAGPSILSGANTSTPTVNAAGTYTLTVTNNTTGCFSTDQVQVTSNGSLPNVDAGADKLLTCTNTTTQLVGNSTSSGVSYVWSGPGIVSGGGTSTAVVNVAGTYTLTVTITTTGCSNADQVVVNADFNRPLANAGADKVITCTNSSQTLGSTAITGVTYSWSPSIGLSNSGIAQPTTSVANTYIVTVTNTSNGCFSKDTVLVSVDTIRPNVTVNSPTICSGETTTLIASGADSYSWTSLGTGNPRTTPALATNTSYTVTGTKSSNGCSNSAVAFVTVKPLPSTPIITQYNDTLEANVIGSSYIWYKNGVIHDTTNIPVIKITESGIYTVKIVGTNQCVSPISANFNAVITGIKNNKLDIKYTIIPNPNNGTFEIRLTSTVNKTYQLKLYNVTGQTILTDELNVRAGQNIKVFNLNDIEKGVYFLTLVAGDDISTQNIIIQ